MFLHSRHYYGLDKGSSAIKIAEITESGGKLAIPQLL
jgi:hypothetical protein